MRWIELSPGFACNCRCSGCFSCSADSDAQMSTDEVQAWLLRSRRQGARHLWLSGGEPTIRKDFMKTLRTAQLLGFDRIKVQSNGMMFAYPDFARRAIDAGMNEVNLLLKSRDAKIHDGLNRTPGSFELLERGVEQLGALRAEGRRLRLEGDVLLTSRNFRELPDLVDAYMDRGLQHFNIWLFSLVDQGERDLRRLVPQLTTVRPFLIEAYDRATARGCSLTSLNTPQCIVPPDLWGLQFDAGGMDLLVVNPGGQSFMLQDSSIEQGVFLPTCEGCAVRSNCHGMRQDYLDVHGIDEIQPVSAEAANGYSPVGSTLDI